MMRVLLIEDDAAMAALATDVLRENNFIVDSTELGEDGLQIGKLYDYDIIILDLTLPDIDGYEVLRRLRAAQVHTPVLIMSGHAGIDSKIRGLRVGADDFLTSKEYGVLEVLSLRKGTPLSKEILLNHLYGGMDEPELKTIDVFVCNLRKKVAVATGGDHYIETVWGGGYVMRDPISADDQMEPALVPCQRSAVRQAA